MKFLHRMRTRSAVLLAAMACVAGASHADIHVGVILSTTGPGASMGMPAEQAIRLWPSEMAGKKVRFTVLNDATDSTTAGKNAMKLISEEKVDVIVGSSLTPPSMAIVEIAGAAKVPVVSLAGGSAIVLPQEGARRWAYKLSPTEAISVNMVLDDMVRRKLKTVATIGIATSYGEGFLKALQDAAPAKGVKLVAAEKYHQTDQSVTAQVLKMMAAQPDAAYIFSAGTPGALPHMELVQRGFKGPIYQTQGVANNDFLRVGGKALEGSYLTVAPVLVPEQLPDSNPVKKVALEFVQKFEAKHGPGSRSLFSATAWDALLMVEAASKEALKSAQPGTEAFRVGVRDALENLRGFVATEGVYSMSDKDHNGVNATSQVMVRIEGGKWKLVP